MAALSVDGTPMPALPNSADQINYDNTTSGLSATTVKGAVDELASEKQDATDNNLTTTNKTIVGGINELKSGLTNVDNSSVKNAYIENGSSIYDWLRSTSNKSGMYLIGATSATDNPFGTDVPAVVVCLKVWEDGSYSQLFAYGGSRGSTNFKKSDLIYPSDVSIPWET